MAKFNFNQNAGFYMIDPMTLEGNGKDINVDLIQRFSSFVFNICAVNAY